MSTVSVALSLEFPRQEDQFITLMLYKSHGKEQHQLTFNPSEWTGNAFKPLHGVCEQKEECDICVFVELWSHSDKEPQYLFASGSFRLQATLPNQVVVYDTLKTKQGTMCLKQSEPIRLMHTCHSDVSLSHQREVAQTESDLYCRKVMELYKRRRPTQSTNWFTTVAFQHATIPLVSAILTTKDVRIDEDTELHWYNMYTLARQHYGVASGSAREKKTTWWSLAINFILALPFCGMVYVTDYIRRANGARQEGDVWNLIRSRPTTGDDESGASFDCEDAALHILQSLRSLELLSNPSSPEVIDLKEIVGSEYKPWLVIGGIRQSGGEYTPHANVVLRPVTPSHGYPVVCIEGTTLTQGVDVRFMDYGTVNGYNDARRLIKSESQLDKWLRDQINVMTPQSVVDEIRMYGDPITMISSSYEQIVCDELKNTHSDVIAHSGDLFQDVDTDIPRPMVSVGLEWCPSVSIESDPKADFSECTCACGQPLDVDESHMKYLYYIRTKTWEMHHGIIQSSALRLYPDMKHIKAERLHLGRELDVIRLCLCFAQ